MASLYDWDTTAANNEQGRALLEAFNFPFRK